MLLFATWVACLACLAGPPALLTAGEYSWAQGYTELLDLMGQHAQRAGPDRAPPIDCYGNGEDLQAVADASAAKRLPLTFHGAKDHLGDSMHEYKVRSFRVLGF